jgi:hypothetical protein
VPAAEQLDGADPASYGESGLSSIEELAGRLISRLLGRLSQRGVIES